MDIITNKWLAMDFSYFELLQLNDATFPIGSYAFSWGLETFVQQGIIHDSESAKEYIVSELYGSFIYGDLLAVRLAYEATSMTKLKELDEIYGASRTPYELREGSQKLATRFIKTTAAFNECDRTESGEYVCRYFPLAYGTYCAKRNAPLNEVLAAFLYSQVSARVTTSVKLVPLSQTEGQKILYSIMNRFSELIEKCFLLDEKDFCRSTPGLDLRAMQHEYLYSRLYSN